MPGTRPALIAEQPRQAIVQAAALAHGIPAWVLQGVWGMETDFGRNVATSSAGAVGDFQFLPSTAAGRGYPLTNTPNQAQFQQQANAAAAYLAQLYHQTGSWNAALQHYSGGGYGQSQVQQKAGQDPNTQSGFPTPSIPNPLAPLSGLANIASLLTSGQFWLGVGEALLAVALILMGLRTLSGSETSPVTIARSAVRAAAVAA